MSRKRRKKAGKPQKKTTEAASKRAPSPGSRKTGLVLVLALSILAVVGTMGWWLRSPEVVFPELDLASMEPRVAALLTERMEAVRESPRSADAWGELGVALQAHGLDREAASAYEKAVERDPSVFRWQYLYVHALRAFDAERALHESARAVEVDPDYSPAHVIRGELLEEQGDTEAALQQYEKALELDPESPVALFGVGRLTLAEGNAEGAVKLLEKARELDPQAGAIHASLAQAYRRHGDRERAAEEARLAFENKSPVAVPDPIHFGMRQESVSSIARLDRAMGAFDAGDFRRAAEILEELVELRPDDADMHSRYGDTLSQLNQTARAKEEYLAALAINPDHASALYGLGNALNREGAHEEAEARYRKALELRPDHVPTLVNLASLVAFQGDVEEAEAMFKRGLELEPEDFSCHRQLGELYLREGRNDEAIATLRAALAIRPDFGPVHASLAVALARTGQFQQAWSSVEKARAAGSELPPQFVEGLRTQLR